MLDQSEKVTAKPAKLRLHWDDIARRLLLAWIALSLSHIASDLTRTPLQEARAHARAIETVGLASRSAPTCTRPYPPSG